MACSYPIKGWKNKLTGSFTYNYWKSDGEVLELNCGKCIGCRLEHSRQWAMRIVHESQMHEKNSFLTLTYDDEHLPKNLSINKRDLQLFIKRLRKHVEKTKGEKIRYYACGEYGDTSNRPHYHGIMFNYWPDYPDLQLYKNDGGNTLYTSDTLTEIWGNGYVVVGQVNFETASYTSRYVTKKIGGAKAEEHYQGREPEFAIMSRRHGIGSTWIEKYSKETWRDLYIILRGRKMLPPKYYKKKLKEQNPEMYKLINEIMKEENHLRELKTGGILEVEKQKRNTEKILTKNEKRFKKSQI